MSFLAPLYIAGLLAVSLPLIFHLIRRQPRKKLAFSSLMFLTESPPRLTRRSRLDDILLLLLRALALAILALAFARPFLREAADLSLDGATGRRVAILLDTSASMRRENLWNDAKAEVQQQIAKLAPTDQVALFTFNDDLQTLVSFDDSTKLEPARRKAIVKSQLDQTAPTWGATNTGDALVTVADGLDALDDARPSEVDASLQIVLITDLQQGSRLEALSAYDWPKDVNLEIKTVEPRQTTNASIQLVTDSTQSERQSDELRVRVTNDSDSTSETFKLRWSTSDEELADVQAYVPPGESRIVRFSPPANNAADQLLLTGDDHGFDNSLHFVPQTQQELTIFYLGPDQSDDTQGLRYYLERAFPEMRQRKTIVASLSPDQPLFSDPTVRLVVVSEPINKDRTKQLHQYLQDGGTVLFVLKDSGATEALARLMDNSNLRVIEASPNNYQMLEEINYDHPLFATFAGPRFSDFTNIHFWKYRQLEFGQPASVEVIARFDSGDPALVEQSIGRGRLLVLSSGWHPSDSELALSSKFVPLLDAVVRMSGKSVVLLLSYHVNDRVSLPPISANASPPSIVKPDGSEMKLTQNRRTFAATDVPGIYHASLQGTRQPFAVNMDSAESQTATMDISELKQRGVRLGHQPTTAEEIQRHRQMQDRELERRQNFWRWLIATALAILLLEIWLAGRLSHKKHELQAAQPAG